MATTNTAARGNSIESMPMVMVRGFENRPFQVRAIASDSRTVVVTGSDENHSLGVPVKNVFELDDQLFAEISAERSIEQRGRAWARARPFAAEQLPRIQ